LKKKLNEIAFRPDNSNYDDYIEVMIINEENVKNPGYSDRIR